MRAVLDLSAALSKLGHRVTLLTLDAGDAPSNWPRVTRSTDLALMPIGNVPTVFVPEGSKPGRSFAGMTARSQSASVIAGADVLHLHGLWEYGNVQALRMAAATSVPAVCTVHGMLDDWSMSQGGWKKRLYLRFVLRPALSRGSRLHFTAEAEQEQSRRWLRDVPSIVIPYVLDVEPYLANGRSSLSLNGPPHVLLLSRLHVKKGIERLIDAADVLAKGGKAIRWTLAGPADEAYLASLQQRVADLKLGDWVSFPGMVSGDAKAALYRSADLFVLPTSQENFGLVLIEAMAAGVPVVTTRGVDIWRELQHAGAEIVDLDDPAVLPNVIQRLLVDPAERDRRSRQGRAWVESAFAGDVTARRFEALYRSLKR